MDNYTKAYTSLLTMLSGALRTEFIGNETIMEDLTTIKLGLNELQDYKKALDKACEYIEFESEPPQKYKTWKEYLLKEVSNND